MDYDESDEVSDRMVNMFIAGFFAIIFIVAFAVIALLSGSILIGVLAGFAVTALVWCN